MAADKIGNTAEKIKLSVSDLKNNTWRRNLKKENSHYNYTVTNLPETKWIRVYINGDEHFQGFKCVVNRKYYPNFDVFLNYLTERLQPSFGAIRNIYTPSFGHPVCSLEDLIPNQKYVVAGNERFKKLEPGYDVSGEKNIKRTERKVMGKHKYSKEKNLENFNLIINFYKNGNYKERPSKVTFRSSDLENWEMVFKRINDVLKYGPIKKICSLNGKYIRFISELINNQTYVIIGKHEVFKNNMHSSDLQSSFLLEKKGCQPLSQQIKKPSSVAKRSASVNNSNSSEQSNSSISFGISLLDRPKSEVLLHHNSEIKETPHELIKTPENISFENKSNINSETNEKHEEIKLNDASFMSKVQEINLDNDFSGIYRAKKQNYLTAGAIEIDEDTETAIDLPIDFLDAKEVEDEITPDMERSLQHLNLDVPDEIVAFLPSIHDKKSTENDQRITSNKYNLQHSHTLDMQNIFV